MPELPDITVYIEALEARISGQPLTRVGIAHPFLLHTADPPIGNVAGKTVHGRCGKPCPDCGTSVQRIRYASSETDYCPRCQTGGRILADRALSRLLKKDRPRTIEEMEGLARQT